MGTLVGVLIVIVGIRDLKRKIEDYDQEKDDMVKTIIFHDSQEKDIKVDMNNYREHKKLQVIRNCKIDHLRRLRIRNPKVKGDKAVNQFLKTGFPKKVDLFLLDRQDNKGLVNISKYQEVL